MRRTAMVSAAVALALVLAGCGSSGTEETTTAAPTTTTTVATTTTAAPTTTSTSTTTTSTTTTTTTTAPPTPEELREEFLAGLDAAGWVTYTDSVIGWSIRYPAEWVVMDAAPGEHLWLASGPATAESAALFMISASLDAGPDSEGSLDYLEGNIDYAIADGLLRTPEEDAWFWLDLDSDGVDGLHDIEGVKASFAKDPTTGSTIPAGQEAPSWWYGYYNPDLHPAYGYMMETAGTVPDFFQVLDDVVLSFEPPGDPSTTTTTALPTHTLSGTVYLVEGAFASSQDGSSCWGTGEFRDINENAHVIVRDGEGRSLAANKLQLGEEMTLSDDTLVCGFSFQVLGVPDADSYTVEVTGDGETTITREQLEAWDWKVQFLLQS